jgi:hypothetical protein
LEDELRKRIELWMLWILPIGILSVWLCHSLKRRLS